MSVRVGIWISKNPDGLIHVYANGVEGDQPASDDDILEAMRLIERIAEGKRKFIRDKACVVSDKNFHTQEIERRGCARFSFYDEPLHVEQ